MSERMDNSRSHAPVLGDELVERGNGGGIAQHHGYLPALVAKCGLTLRAGLGLHGLLAGLAELCRRGFQRCHVFGVRLLRLGELAGHLVATDLGDGFDERGHSVSAAGFGVHFSLRVGPIPTMCLSSHVTSDASTPSGNIFLNGGRA